MSECLNLVAFNISGIPLHLDSCVDQCINVGHVRFGILAFCETRLNGAMCSLYSIDHYESYFDNKSTAAGALAFHVNTKFDVRLLSHLSFQLPYTESFFLEITKPVEFLLGITYCPPNSDVDSFISALHNIVTTANKIKTLTIKKTFTL